MTIFGPGEFSICACNFSKTLFPVTILNQIVRSKKYDVAVNKETPVMTSEWIDIVWTKGQSENIHATDPQFAR